MDVKPVFRCPGKANVADSEGKMFAGLSVGYLIPIVFIALFSCLVIFTLYLGVRGKVFLPRVTEKKDPLDGETRRYMNGMEQVIQAVDTQNPHLGTDRFDETVYLDLIERLSKIPQPTGAPYFEEDAAYRKALERFVDLRRQTVRSVREAAPAVLTVIGDGVVDGRSVSAALHLMSTYSPSVDDRLVALNDDCAREKRAYEALRQWAREWQVATYARRFGADQAGRPILSSVVNGAGTGTNNTSPKKSPRRSATPGASSKRTPVTGTRE